MALVRWSHIDSPEALTELLHRAYASHAAEGRRFFASYQSVQDTKDRIGMGECWVAVEDGRLIGTVTVLGGNCYPDGYPSMPSAGCFTQLAVDPEVRGTGLGHDLLIHAESRLRELGCTSAVIDTSTEATALVDWYCRRGYERVGNWNWEVTNYESVVLAKAFER